MADEHLENIAEMRLPAKFFRRSVGIAFDVGKCTKLLYIRAYCGVLAKVCNSLTQLFIYQNLSYNIFKDLFACAAQFREKRMKK